MKLIWPARKQMNFSGGGGRASVGFELCISTAVLHQMSYRWRPICWWQTNLSSSSLPMTGMRRETKLIRNAGIQIKWLMKNHMLRADQFIEFIFTCDRNVTWNEVHLNCRNTDEMWWCDFRVRICNCLNCDYNCDDHIFISTVYFVFQGIFRSCLWSVFSL